MYIQVCAVFHESRERGDKSKVLLLSLCLVRLLFLKRIAFYR